MERKNELICRLAAITGKERREFMTLTLKELSELYAIYSASCERRYINVAYKDKGVAKLLGAKYDGNAKSWYIPPGVDEKLFETIVVKKEKTE